MHLAQSLQSPLPCFIFTRHTRNVYFFRFPPFVLCIFCLFFTICMFYLLLLCPSHISASLSLISFSLSQFFFSHHVYFVISSLAYSVSLFLSLSHLRSCLLFHSNLQWRDDALAPNPFIWRITKVWLDIRVEGGEGRMGETELGSRVTIQKYRNIFTQCCNIASILIDYICSRLHQSYIQLSLLDILHVHPRQSVCNQPGCKKICKKKTKKKPLP